MITIYNDNQAWNDLFQRAWEDYQRVVFNKTEPVAPYRFLTIDDYFAHIGDLVEINENYLMLPIDENPFVINANTRTISVPADFAKCAAVVGDNLCEIVTFTIDRYFDFKDLAGENVQIAVQWKNPKGEDGITQITLKDYEYEYGKIRFGWPLTSNIACAPGNIQFSVRFYEGSVGEDGKIDATYLLNTLTASIPVKASLVVDGAVEHAETDTASTLASFVNNSRYISGQIKVPAAPTFSAKMGGINLPAADDLEGNELTIEALAISPEGFPMTYSWYHEAYPNESGIVETFELSESNADYTIDHETYIKSIDTIPSQKKNYYVLEDGEYIATGIITSFIEDVDYYEKGSSLKINSTDNKNIVGNYYVKVQSENRYDVNGVSGVNKSSVVDSNSCLVAKPEPISITKELEPSYILENGKANLSITSSNENVIYTWYKDDAVIDGAQSNTFEATESGFYKVKISLDKNRYPVSDESEAPSKVANAPAKPKTATVYYKAASGEWIEPPDTSFTGKIGDTIEIKVVTDLDKYLPGGEEADEFISEGLQYQWYRATNSTTTPVAIEGANNAELIITVTDSTYYYTCVVKNIMCGTLSDGTSLDEPISVLP